MLKIVSDFFRVYKELICYVKIYAQHVYLLWFKWRLQNLYLYAYMTYKNIIMFTPIFCLMMIYKYLKKNCFDLILILFDS